MSVLASIFMSPVLHPGNWTWDEWMLFFIGVLLLMAMARMGGKSGSQSLPKKPLPKRPKKEEPE